MTYFIHNFRPNTRLVLDQVKDILLQYQSHLPLGVRRIYYSLISQRDPLVSANKSGYNSVKYILNKARFAGEISFDHIVDDTRQTYNLPFKLEDLLPNYYPDAWESQRNYVEVIVEKSAQASFYRRLLRPLFVPVTPTRGNDSVTNIMDVAVRLHQYRDRRRIVHIHSDLDPKGDGLEQDVAFRLAKCLIFLGEQPLGYDEKARIALVENLEVVKILLIKEQALELRVPFAPIKEEGKTRARFVEKNGEDGIVEMDAIPADKHETMILEPILPLLDMGEVERARTRYQRLMREGPEIMKTLESSLSLSRVEGSAE